ncbi:SLC13 family permease [Crassaminicella profunda]|uniref:SLC13 family permease n=1 Tax=Crassaminicella profunda TaxID=1286698 RepID=UPI001FE906C0|nr:ArsB/NhaD family transporter [Crassaminicella profunda]
MVYSSQLYITITIFILTYAVIVSEKINRMTIAFFGALLLVLFRIIDLEFAFQSIDFDTIGLLIGMMIVVNITKKTGVFQYIAIKSAKFAKGDPWHILLMLCIITAISSALLDNVTTVLLIAPVTLVITETLEVDPIPFMLSQILAANIGGTATLIGDPPNIMIGSETGLGFMDFISNLLPVVLIIYLVTFFFIKKICKPKLHVKESLKSKIMKMDETLALTDTKLLKKSLFVLLITILGFALHQLVGLETATVALGGASILLLISNVDPEEILQEIEWLTIFFFAFLFILVGGLEKVGVIDFIAKNVVSLTKGNLMLTTLLVLWVSALASSFLDNIPFVATMIPLINSIGTLSNFNITPLWWALALGACLGGNGTLVGASANVVVAGILEKHNHKISFKEYMKIAFPLMILSIILSSIYLYIFYL